MPMYGASGLFAFAWTQLSNYGNCRYEQARRELEAEKWEYDLHRVENILMIETFGSEQADAVQVEGRVRPPASQAGQETAVISPTTVLVSSAADPRREIASGSFQGVRYPNPERRLKIREQDE